MQLVEAGNTAFQCLAKYVCNCCLAASTVHPEQHDQSINQSINQLIAQSINILMSWGMRMTNVSNTCS